MEQREETAAGRRERRGGWGEGEGFRRLGGEDERRDTKERLGIREDQRLSGKEEKGERMGVGGGKRKNRENGCGGRVVQKV